MPISEVEKDEGWERFYRATAGRATSPLLRRALGPGFLPYGSSRAVDLGFGAGVETAFLLSAGWQVLAIDKEPRAVARLKALEATAQTRDRLVAIAKSFEELEELPSSALIHAGLSLPFCAPASFSRFWTLIVAALEPDGKFVGHFFGDKHDWTRRSEMSFHTKGQVQDLCNGLEIELLRETEGDGGQVPHHWHRFDLIAKKP